MKDLLIYCKCRNFGEQNIWQLRDQLHLARIKFDKMTACSRVPHLTMPVAKPVKLFMQNKP